jgi:transcription initiation factor TFIIB
VPRAGLDNKMEIEQAWAQFDELRTGPEPTEYPCSRFNSSNVCECGEYRQFVPHVFEGFVLSGDLPVCLHCGRCDDSYISDEPEWNDGVGDDGEVTNNARVGAPKNDLYSERWNLGTNMPLNSRFGRMNLYLSISSKDRALYLAYQELDNVIKKKLNLPDYVMHAAKAKYKSFVEKVLTRGAVRTGIKAHCIFQACKEANLNRTSKEIADAFGIEARDMSRTTDLYKSQNPDEVETDITRPKDLIPRFFNNIECEDSRRLKMRCIAACKSLENCVKLQGRTPKAVACAVIFVVLAGKVTKKQICEICDVSPPTLSKLEPIIKEQLALREQAQEVR